MKVFVSPHENVVEFPGDFICTDEGELLSLWNCPCDCETCPKIMFSGLESHRSTSVARVVDRADLNPDVLEEIYLHDLAARGWNLEADDHEDAREWARYLVNEATNFTAAFEVGDLIERVIGGVVLRPATAVA